MRGDILLYKAKSHDPFDAIVAKATGGPFVHVEIDLGNNQAIGEKSMGLNSHPIPANRGIVLVPIAGLEPQKQEALKWVERQSLGQHPYGAGSLINDLFKMTRISLRIAVSGAWDCSEFVSRYLIRADAAGPLGDLVDDISTISPNDIARAYGAL